MTRARVGSETEVLRGFLDQQRDVLLWKLEGLDEEQVRLRPSTGHLRPADLPY